MTIDEIEWHEITVDEGKNCQHCELSVKWSKRC
jgi:hypothetical protein